MMTGRASGNSISARLRHGRYPTPIGGLPDAGDTPSSPARMFRIRISSV